MNTSTNIVPVDDLPNEVRASRVVPVDDLPVGLTGQHTQQSGQPQVQPEVQQSQQASDEQGIYQKVRPYIETATEAVGLGGGSVIGTAAGPVGTVAGGTLGYMAAGEVMDLLDQAFGDKAPQSIKDEARQQLSRALEGATITASGEIVGPLIKGVVRPIGKAFKAAKELIPAITEKGVQKKVGKVLSELGANAAKGQVENNIAIADELKKKIPGLKFTLGQITNDADAIALENALSRTAVKTRQGGVITGRELSQQQKAFANKTLQDYYDKVLLKNDNVGDFTKKVASQQGALESTKKSMEDKVKAEIARLNGAMDEQNIGRGLVEKTRSLEQTSKEKAKKLYDKIPNIKLPTEDLNKGIDSIVKQENNILEPRTEKMIKLIRAVTNKNNEAENTGYQALRSLRSRVGRMIKEAKYGEDFEDARQLSMLSEKVDNAMGQVKDINPQVEKLYNEATRFYREEYVPKFRRGTVADILRQGNRGEETKIALSSIAKQFWSKDGIDDFMRTVGNDKVAVDLMKDYARYDLVNRGAINPVTGEVSTTKVFGWLQKNAKILKKLNIYDEFKNVAGLKRGLDKAASNLDVFNKSVAGKVLNADVDSVVAQAFSGKGMINPAKTANDLLKLAGGDKAAEAGIKKAFAEHILEKSKKPTFDIFENPEIAVSNMTKRIKEFGPAIRTFYKNEPKKLKALMDIRKAYEIINRTAKPPLGGVAEVTDNLLGVISGAGVSSFGRYRLIVKIPDLITRYGKNQVNEYLMRAMFDPDYAMVLKSYLKAPKDKRIATRFTQLMTELAGIGIKNATQSETKKGGE